MLNTFDEDKIKSRHLRQKRHKELEECLQIVSSGRHLSVEEEGDIASNDSSISSGRKNDDSSFVPPPPRETPPSEAFKRVKVFLREESGGVRGGFTMRSKSDETFGSGFFFPSGKDSKVNRNVNLAPRKNSIYMLDSPYLASRRNSFMSVDFGQDGDSISSQHDMIRIITLHEWSGRRTIAIVVVLACIIGSLCVILFFPRIVEKEWHESIPIPSSVSDPERYRNVKRIIIENGISSAASINKKGTPQHEALLWIADVDGAKLGVDDKMIFQRYSLAVFFYSTYADIAVEDEHEWDKAAYTMNDSSRAMAKSGNNRIKPIAWRNSTNWMSSKGHCSWAGVGCHFLNSTTKTTHVYYDGNYRVTHLNLTRNNVRGTIPNEIIALEDLQLLNLGTNLMSGTIPENIGDLKHLVTIHLGANGLTGSLPTYLGKLEVLTHLYLHVNKLDGKIPNELNNSKELRVLSLFKNKLVGNIPNMRKLNHLTDLRLDANKLGGSIPTEIGLMTSLKDLRLSQNDLKGTIPSEIGNLKYLEKFHAYENELQGNLPPQLVSLENLKILYLDNNNFTGSIPPIWGGSGVRSGMQDLEQLYLQKNKLSGNIPTQFGALGEMLDLKLHKNHIGGAIPSEMGKMLKLKYVYLDNNKLTGKIPEEMGKLSSLEKLHINGNQITGKVSENMCSLSKSSGGNLVEFLMDCDVENNEAECNCCTSCV
uniref:Leucine-rich repeat-containing N-terminal plant-type domain-containing protein n=1 Tax=Ditylum brightwellii TaxID=49249 RepID=A0A7S4T436_9STRA